LINVADKGTQLFHAVGILVSFCACCCRLGGGLGLRPRVKTQRRGNQARPHDTAFELPRILTATAPSSRSLNCMSMRDTAVCEKTLCSRRLETL
jgi:hypothetical protein